MNGASDFRMRHTASECGEPKKMRISHGGQGGVAIAGDGSEEAF